MDGLKIGSNTTDCGRGSEVDTGKLLKQALWETGRVCKRSEPPPEYQFRTASQPGSRQL